LRGLDQRALAVEFRFRDGNSDWYSYGLLSNWRYNPSAVLLLKFTSDVTTLVLIRGSNLNALVGDKPINLTDRGFQRHGILWVREMDESKLRQVEQAGPTIDKIDVVEVESQENQPTRLMQAAPAFHRSAN
jgi:hypothetical protein